MMQIDFKNRADTLLFTWSNAEHIPEYWSRILDNKQEYTVTSEALYIGENHIILQVESKEERIQAVKEFNERFDKSVFNSFMIVCAIIAIPLILYFVL